MSELIDTTEMYLRTIYELIEEGVPPMRARIAERLRQSGPTVSQTVARMERDGLLTVHEDRRIELSQVGYQLAEDVMRKHRLAERMLTDIIGLEWPQIHDEACRWEHVISDEVERRLLGLVQDPTTSPYGNPIPGLGRLGMADSGENFLNGVHRLIEAIDDEDVEVEIVRLGEKVQTQEVLTRLFEIGALPGARVKARLERGWVWLSGPSGEADLDRQSAEHLFVRAE